MRVSDTIAAGGLILRPSWSTFEETVEGLVDSLVHNGQIPPPMRDTAVRAVCEREKLASTIIAEIGVSIPHARLNGVRGVVAAIAASPTAIFHAMTGVPITVLALVLSGPELAGEHLNFLSALSIRQQSEAVRSGLGRATDTETALQLLRA